MSRAWELATRARSSFPGSVFARDGENSTNEARGAIPRRSNEAEAYPVLFSETNYSQAARGRGRGLAGSSGRARARGQFAVPVRPVCSSPFRCRSAAPWVDTKKVRQCTGIGRFGDRVVFGERCEWCAAGFAFLIRATKIWAFDLALGFTRGLRIDLIRSLDWKEFIVGFAGLNGI